MRPRLSGLRRLAVFTALAFSSAAATAADPAYARWDDIRRFGVQMTFGLRGTF